MNKRFWLGVAALLFAARAWAGEVAVSGAWIEASAPGQDSAIVSMIIMSQKDAHLVAVSSPASASAEMHTMTYEEGMMMMHAVAALTLPAKHEIVFGPSGDHIHLIGLKRPLKAGDSVPLKLTVEFADKSKEELTVKADVRPLTESHDMQGMPGMN
ncbi:MAG: copper chaperone PCu(A)C [Gallionellaceae bacterium]